MLRNSAVSRAGLVCLLAFCLILTGCKEKIVHNLSENDANRYLARLDEISAGASKVKQPDGKWSISVDKTKAILAIKHLGDSRMLKSSDAPASEQSSLISSREDQRFKFERALSREIENTLASIEGVLEARVHLNLPGVDPILGHRLPASKGTGSVLLVIKKDFQLTTEMIADLVSGASGIETGQIAVLFNLESSSIREPAVTPAPKEAVVPVQARADAGSGTSAREVYAGFACAVLLAGCLLIFRGVSRRGPKLKTSAGEIYDDFAGDILQ